VEVPIIADVPPVVRALTLREQAPSTPGVAAAEAATAFEHLIERLLETATRELLLGRLGEQLARTTRQVNVLEQRLEPRLRAELTATRRVLEEREREDQLRLRHLTEAVAGGAKVG
jgi:vacuolar-type H+-ATPase subunit D/Vma8